MTPDRAALREKIAEAIGFADAECRHGSETEAGQPCESCVTDAFLTFIEPLLNERQRQEWSRAEIAEARLTAEQVLHQGDCEALVAYRTALSEAEAEVAEWEQTNALMRRREAPLIARWQQETGKLDTLPDYGAMLAWLVKQADDAKAKM